MVLAHLPLAPTLHPPFPLVLPIFHQSPLHPFPSSILRPDSRVHWLFPSPNNFLLSKLLLFCMNRWRHSKLSKQPMGLSLFFFFFLFLLYFVALFTLVFISFECSVFFSFLLLSPSVISFLFTIFPLLFNAVCLSVGLFFYVSVCPSICLFFYLSV